MANISPIQKSLIYTTAYLRRTLGIRRGLSVVNRFIYPASVRQESPIETIIRYDRAFDLKINTRSLIEWEVFMNGYYEYHLIRLFTVLLRPGDNVIDVGANIGVHTLAMSNRVGENGAVLAIEPFPPVRLKLENTIENNQITNIRIIPKAVSDKPGTATLYNPDTQGSNEGRATLFKEAEGHSESVSVEVDTLDHIFEQSGLPSIKLIKFDIQGGEHAALVGATSLLKRSKPFVIFEYSTRIWKTIGASYDQTADLFPDYRFYLIVQNGKLVPLTSKPDSEGTFEILAVPFGQALPPELVKQP